MGQGARIEVPVARVYAASLAAIQRHPMPAPARWSCSLLALLAAACGGKTGDLVRLAPARRGIDAAGRMHPGPADRCPICAMTTDDSKGVAAIELDDGTAHYFCCAGCMLQAWLAPQEVLAAGTRRIARARAVDYFTGEHVDAAEVHWVAGSDAVGPMGRRIVPLQGDAALAKFRERHGGTVVFRLHELDSSLLQRAQRAAPEHDARR
ncbi:MAG: hypothetical protein FJ265_01370 [Planctomycetes bacterium]|nr:hypothetical protein [Planctomycetota bacterium]